MESSSALSRMPIRELCGALGVGRSDVLGILGSDLSPGRHADLSPSQVRSVLSALGMTPAFRTVAVMNLKGGVGKTTSCVSLAARAVQYGIKTCVLDLDAQASATMALGLHPDEDALIFGDVWREPERLLADALRQVEGSLFVLASALENSLLDVQLANPASQKRAVTAVCDVLRREGFGLVVVDCPPSLGAAVISAACAANTILIPAAGDAFSLRGIELTVQEVKAIRSTFGLPPNEIRILPTMIDRRQTLSVGALEKLARRYGDAMLPGIVRVSTEYSRCLEKRVTVFSSSRRGHGKDDYDLVTRAVLGLPVPAEPTLAPVLAQGRSLEAEPAALT